MFKVGDKVKVSQVYIERHGNNDPFFVEGEVYTVCDIVEGWPACVCVRTDEGQEGDFFPNELVHE